jgi:hypothetical protein
MSTATPDGGGQAFPDVRHSREWLLVWAWLVLIAIVAVLILFVRSA